MELSEDQFFQEIEKEYGKYLNEYNLINALKYINKFIRKDRLNDVLTFVKLYYVSSNSTPPKMSDIEQSIKTALRENKGGSPYIKDYLPNRYNPDEFKHSNEYVSKDEAAQNMRIILDMLKEKKIIKKKLDNKL